MPESRYLTKSKFKLASECLTKLFYSGKLGYANQKLEDPFLSALADGGYQVGELAKLYFPANREVSVAAHDEAVVETERLLAEDEATIFEAAFRHGNLFVRADIVVKKGLQLDLIEVKAKSFDGADSTAFRGRGGQIKSEWKSYL